MIKDGKRVMGGGGGGEWALPGIELIPWTWSQAEREGGGKRRKKQ